MRIYQTLLLFASIVVIISGLRAASDIITPFLIATFISIVISPILSYFEKFGLNRALSFLIVIAILFTSLGFICSSLITSFNKFLIQLPNFQTKFLEIFGKFNDWVNSFDIDLNSYLIDTMSSLKIFSTTGSVMKFTSTFIGKLVFILILTLFILLETNTMKKRLNYLYKIAPKASSFITKFIKDVKRYLAIKTLSSLTTGILIWLLLKMLGIPYAILWGAIAFVFDYVPAVGSIVASIPAIVVTLLTKNIVYAFLVTAVYLSVNMLIGNFLEPKFMQKGFGISPILVLFSLLFWGYIFGLTGMFLAVPLTMCIKIGLDQNQKTQIFSNLISSNIEN